MNTIDTIAFFGAVNNAYKNARATGKPQTVKLSDYEMQEDNSNNENVDTDN